jgi:hypothetical protein
MYKHKMKGIIFKFSLYFIKDFEVGISEGNYTKGNYNLSLNGNIPCIMLDTNRRMSKDEYWKTGTYVPAPLQMLCSMD